MPALRFDKKIFVESIAELVGSYLRFFPDEASRLELLRQLLDGADERIATRQHLPGHLTASALVLHGGSSSALLIHHNFLKRWLQPGGHLEGAEHPLDGARREVAEEVGPISISLHPFHEHYNLPLDIDSHAIPANESKGELAHYHHDFQYVFFLTGRNVLKLQESEVSDFRWVPLEAIRAGDFGARLARVAKKIETLSQLLS